ncbi:MAG: DUF4058 family protein [Isosphaeraceae bacterium]|nr:DUF4058 family protein [Isosphaeraceae bacterium]
MRTTVYRIMDYVVEPMPVPEACDRFDAIRMPSPFPGVDPYLEDPGLWPDGCASWPDLRDASVSQRDAQAEVSRPHRGEGLHLRRE